MDGQSKPDWVMCGIETEEGVAIIASKQLHTARLDVEQEFISSLGHFNPIRTYEWYVLSAELGEYVMVAGRDYSEAFQRLFEHWNAGTSVPRGELPGGRSLEEGDSGG